MMLELRNIYKTYLQGKLEVPVLKNISLSVEEGEYVAIMGPSGSGKTTLMNIIGCLDNPTSGDYLLEGVNISQNNDSKMSEVRLHSIGFPFCTQESRDRSGWKSPGTLWNVWAWETAPASSPPSSPAANASGLP